MKELIHAIKMKDKETICAKIEVMGSFNNETLNMLLAESPSEEISVLLKTLDKEKRIKKYTSGNEKINKAAQILLNAFRHNIIDICDDVGAVLSLKIAETVYKLYSGAFPKIIREKAHNLKENRKLCYEVYEGKIEVEKFVKMSAAEMLDEKLKDKDNKVLKDSLLDLQMAKATAETEIFECSRCKQRKCTYYQLQTRSCDEPMTTFVTCVACGHRWRF